MTGFPPRRGGTDRPALPAWARHAGGDPGALGGLALRRPAAEQGPPAALRALADRDLVGALDQGAGAILAAASAVERDLATQPMPGLLERLADGIDSLAEQIEAATRAATLMGAERHGAAARMGAEHHGAAASPGTDRARGTAATGRESAALERLIRAGIAADAVADDVWTLLDRIAGDAP